MSKPIYAYECEPPARWKAGETGTGEPLYFDCGRCGEHDVAIAGFLGTGPTFLEMLVIRREDSSFFNTAMYCPVCWPVVLEEKRLAWQGTPA